MASMLFEGRVVLVVMLLVVATGCSKSPAGSAGAGGATGSGGAGTGAGGQSGGDGMAGTSGGGGSAMGGRGGGGTGGNPFAGATPLTVGAPATAATLADATNARNTYSFPGTQGQVIQIVTTTGPNPFDPSYLDLVVTLYGPNQRQLAQSLDPWPRVTDAPSLFTVLPATGTYHIEIENCYSVFVTSCRIIAPIVNRGYTVRVAEISGPTLIREGAEPGNDAASGAAAITYTKAGGSSYLPLLVHGVFQSEADRDTYTFAVPTDVPVAPGTRARANFWIQDEDPEGNGSTARASEVYVIDPADTSGAHVVGFDAWDFGNGTLSVAANLTFPVQLGKTYTFAINHRPSLQPGSNGFYLMQHLGGAGPGEPPLEQEPNDTQATADSLAAIANLDGSFTFTVDGDLSPAASDVDFHRLQLPSGMTSIQGQCMGRRIGSGLTLLKYTLVTSDGTPFVERTETGNADSLVTTIEVPAGGFTLRVSATGQSTSITNNSYICRVVAKP